MLLTGAFFQKNIHNERFCRICLSSCAAISLAVIYPRSTLSLSAIFISAKESRSNNKTSAPLLFLVRNAAPYCINNVMRDKSRLLGPHKCHQSVKHLSV